MLMPPPHSIARALAPLSGLLDRALGGPRQVVWVIGDGRSGTSWVADLLARTCNYRQLYEPFHPGKVRMFEGYRLNHYQRRGTRNDDLEARLGDVFAGRVASRRVNQDTNRFRYDGLLVKDVFATLIAAWTIEKFPQVKPVLQVRNPFPVALSKAKRPNWLWTSGPRELLRQHWLLKDHLEPHADFLKHVEAQGDPFLNHVAVWAILHYCLFRDVDARSLHVVKFRRILRDPTTEMRQLLDYLGEQDADANVPPEILRRAARYSDAASVQQVKGNRDQSWADELTAIQIRRGKDVLEHFGLARLFDGIEPASDFEEVAASLWRGGPNRTVAAAADLEIR